MRPGLHGELVLEGNLETAIFAQALEEQGAYATSASIDPPPPPPIGWFEFYQRYPSEHEVLIPPFMIKDHRLAIEALHVVRGWLQGSDFALFARFSRKRFLINRIEKYERGLLEG